MKPSALHVQVPLPPDLLPPERWTSLVVHLPSLVAALFSENGNSRGVAVFNKIEQVGVGAHCRVRKIFTLRDAPVVDGGSAPGGGSEQLPFANGAENNEGAVPAGRDSVGFFDADNDRPQRIPKAVDFPNGVHHLLSVVYPSRLSRGAVSRERSRGSSRGNTGPGGLSEFAGVPSGGRPVVSRGSGRGVRHGNGNGDGNGNGNGNGSAPYKPAIMEVFNCVIWARIIIRWVIKALRIKTVHPRSSPVLFALYRPIYFSLVLSKISRQYC